MDGVKSSSEAKGRFHWRGAAAAITAGLGGFYHKSLRLDLWLWLPALVYWIWLNRLIWFGATFATPAGEIRGLILLICQGAFLFLAILVLDGWLAATGSRWRVVFVALVHIILASLYLDCVLYRLMALHLVPAVGILFQGGVSRLGINWAHTGIPAGTIGPYALGGALVVLGVIAYSSLLGAPRPRMWAQRSMLRVKAGRVGLLAVYPLVVCQMLGVSDDHDFQVPFAELRKSLPVSFGVTGTKPGRRLIVPRLRPLREARETVRAVESHDLEPGTYPDVFLFVLESARGDFIDPQITPNLARLRAECLPVRTGLAAANASHISWYSLLTANHGLYFGAEKRAAAHAGSVPLQLFRRLGYTVNVLCSSTLDYHEVDRIAFGSDLQLCDTMFDAQKSGIGDAPACDLAVNGRLLQALDEPPGNRLFLIFYHSTHHDYDWPAGDPTPFEPYVATWKYNDFRIGREQLARIMNRYRNAFHFQDRLIGDVLARLKTSGIYENSVIAVTGDHGEEFLEHGKLLHASNLFGPQTRVPFLLRLPPARGNSQTRMTAPAGTHVDLLPTVLDHLGLNATNLFDGESLLRKTFDEVIVVAENRDLDPVRFCLQSPHYKAFFEFEFERRPTLAQRAVYLRQITDTNDVPVAINLATPEATALVRTNFGTILQSLFPGYYR